MRNAETFIRQWQKKRRKGKLKYILINSAVYCTVYWVVAILYLIWTGKDIYRLYESLDVFMIFAIVYVISLLRVWKKNEDKYNGFIDYK